MFRQWSVAICLAVVGFAGSCGSAYAEAGGGPSMSGAIADNARLEITYDGTAEGVGTFRDNSRNSRITFGPFNVNLAGTRDVSARATYHVVVVYDGSSVTGTETQRSDEAFLNGNYTFRGTRQGTTCLLTTDGGKQVTAHCTDREFSYVENFTNDNGPMVKGNFRFAAQATSLVDVAERERRQREERLAAEQAEQTRRAAAEAAWRALPNAGPALTQRLDGYVLTDSRGWAFNRYAPGSMHDVKVVSGSVRSGRYVLKGYFSYAGGSQGWVMAQMSGGKLDCIQFWDAVIGCRNLRTPEQGQALRNAAVGAVLGDGDSGRESHGTDPGVVRDVIEANRRQACPNGEC